MLSPFGELLVNQQDEVEETFEEDDMSEVPEQALYDSSSLTPQPVPYTHEGDIEDAIADEAPRNNSTSEVTIHVTLQRALLSDLDKGTSFSGKDASAPRYLA